MLGVSKSTLRNWDRQGFLRAVRIKEKGHRRYKLKDVEELLEKYEKSKA